MLNAAFAVLYVVLFENWWFFYSSCNWLAKLVLFMNLLKVLNNYIPIIFFLPRQALFKNLIQLL